MPRRRRRTLMRTWTLLLVRAAALAGSSGAVAAPIDGNAIKAAAEQIGVGESVHCRPFRHWHRWGYGRGWGGATVRSETFRGGGQAGTVSPRGPAGGQMRAGGQMGGGAVTGGGRGGMGG